MTPDALSQQSVFLVWHGEGVTAAYATRALAEAHLEADPSPDAEIEEMDLRSAPPTWRPYYHATGQVGETDASVDIAPVVEERGITEHSLEDERVGTCPGSEWQIGSQQDSPSIWLSVFGMDETETLRRCTEKFDELRSRRDREGRLPSWSDLTHEEFQNA